MYKKHKKVNILYISVPAGKKDKKKYLIQKSINQSSYMNAEIEWGRGGKSVFFPQQRSRYKSGRLARYR